MNAKEPQPLANVLLTEGYNGSNQKNGRNPPKASVKKPANLPPPPPPPPKAKPSS
jgi:hypothetical protein